MLVGAGANVNATSMHGFTPLFLTARMGQVAASQMLIGAGANVHATDDYGRTPLHWTAWSGDVHGSHVLVGAGANVHATDDDGKTPLHWSAEFAHVEVSQFLLEAGANVHAASTHGQTPLHATASVHVSHVLVGVGANVHATDNDGRTPLHLSAAKGLVEVSQMLIEAGANVHATDKWGNTPLHSSAAYCHLEVSQILVGAGANVHATDDNVGRPTPHTLSIEKDGGGGQGSLNKARQHGRRADRLVALLRKDADPLTKSAAQGGALIRARGVGGRAAGALFCLDNASKTLVAWTKFAPDRVSTIGRRLCRSDLFNHDDVVKVIADASADDSDLECTAGDCKAVLHLRVCRGTLLRDGWRRLEHHHDWWPTHSSSRVMSESCQQTKRCRSCTVTML